MRGCWRENWVVGGGGYSTLLDSEEVGVDVRAEVYECGAVGLVAGFLGAVAELTDRGIAQRGRVSMMSMGEFGMCAMVLRGGGVMCGCGWRISRE